MANRKRNRRIEFCVTEDEWKQIRMRMILSKTRNMGAYLRKMAMDGYIIHLDEDTLKKQYYEMHHIGVNVNQMAKIANATGSVDAKDIQEVKGMLQKLWQLLRSNQSNLQ